MLHRALTWIAALAAVASFSSVAQGQGFSSRYARAIGMGDTYTGVAEGLEASYYNNAGLAGLADAAAAFSWGQGEGLPYSFRAFDAAAAMPFDSGIGTVAASYHACNADYTWAEQYFNLSQLQLHYGRHVIGGLSLGASLNVNRIGTDLVRRDETNAIIASGARSHTAFGCSLSCLYSAPALLPGWDDLLRGGIHLDNAAQSEMEEFGRSTQHLSVGLSYRCTPPLAAVAGRTPLRILLAAALHYDNSLSNASYSWNVARPNIGIELQVLDLFRLRFGRENRMTLGSWNTWPDVQYPVTRAGAGADLPVGSLLHLARDLRVRIDYAHSFRDNEQYLDDVASYLYDVSRVPRDAATIQILYRP